MHRHWIHWIFLKVETPQLLKPIRFCVCTLQVHPMLMQTLSTSPSLFSPQNACSLGGNVTCNHVHDKVEQTRANQWLAPILYLWCTWWLEEKQCTRDQHKPLYNWASFFLTQRDSEASSCITRPCLVRSNKCFPAQNAKPLSIHPYSKNNRPQQT